MCKKERNKFTMLFEVWCCIIITLVSIVDCFPESWINGTLMKYPYKDKFINDLLVSNGGNILSVVDPKRKIVGCWLAKVGSREIIKTFEKMANVKKFDALTIEKAFNDPTFKRFVVIRDPLARVVSAYMDKYSWRYPRYGKSHAMWYKKNHLAGNLTNWDTYLKQTNQNATLKLLLQVMAVEPKKKELYTDDIHLMPQHRLCYLRRIRYDYVIDLNHIKYGFQSMEKRENLSVPLLGFQHQSLQIHRNHANNKICDHVDEWVEKKVREVYWRDYEILEKFGMKNLITNVKELCKNHKGGLLQG